MRPPFTRDLPRASRMRLAVVALALFWSANPSARAVDLPIGHKDFMPTPQHPTGWRGDGNGSFPGATPVTYWTEGQAEPIQVNFNTSPTRAIKDPHPVNILWKTPLKGWANNQPIVVGKKVFTTTEPNTLVCLDADTGKVLWEKSNSPFEMMGLPTDDVAALDEYLAMLYTARMIPATMLGNYCNLKVDLIQKDPEPWKRYLDTSRQVLESLIANNKFGANAKDALEKVKAALPLFSDPKANAGQIQRTLGGFVWHLGTEWIQKQYRMWGVVHWDAWMGWTFATPVSDGERIYASMGQGQAVCYDFDGNRIWGVFLPFDPKRCGRGCGCMHCSSPLLCGDVVLVQGISDLYGLDRKTGRTLWRASTARKSYNGFNEVGSHALVTLPSGRRVVATTSGHVFDVATGKQVGDLGFVRSSNTGMVCMKNIVPLQTGPGGGAGGSSRLTGIALEDGDAGAVVCKRLWELPMPGVDSSPVLHEGIYYSSGGGAVGDVVAGRRWDDGGVGEFMRVLVGNSSSPIIAGDCLIGYDGGTAYHAAPYPYVVAREMRVGQIVRPGYARLLSAGMFVDAGGRPRDPRVEKYNPEWAEKGWLNDSGLPAQFGNGSPCAHGERIYIRSCAALICIGPSVKGTPADDPAQAERIRKANAPDAVVEFLASKSDEYRFEACRALARMGPAAKGAADKLSALASQDRHPDVRAAAIEALDAGAPAAKPGQTLLKTCILNVFARTPPPGSWGVYDAGATLRALGEPYVLAVLLPMLNRKETEKGKEGELPAALRMVQLANVKDTSVRDALVAALPVGGESAVRSLAVLWPTDPATLKAMREMLAQRKGDVQAMLRHLKTCLPPRELSELLLPIARATPEGGPRQEYVGFLVDARPVSKDALEWITSEARNGSAACIAALASAIGEDAAAPVLVEALSSPNGTLRAANVLLKMKHNLPEVAGAFARAAGSVKGEAIYGLQEVATGLANSGKSDYDATVIAGILKALTQQVPDEGKRRCLAVLGTMGKRAAPALEDLMKLAAGPNMPLGTAAQEALKKIEGAPAKP